MFRFFQPPVIVLNIAIVEARTLEAKDADGECLIIMMMMMYSSV